MLRFLLGLLYFFRFHCSFICQELCWMRGLCISFTSSCFLFPVGGGGRGAGVRGWGGGEVWQLEGLGGGGKNFRTGGGYFCWGVSTSLHAMNKAKCLTWNSIRLKFAKNTSMPDSVKNFGYIKSYGL